MDAIEWGKPEKNYQANLSIRGAPIYRYTAPDVYENYFLLEGDILLFYDEEYVIFQDEDVGNAELSKRKVQSY